MKTGSSMRNKWKKFEEKHPKIAKLLIQLLYFWVFSMGVTFITGGVSMVIYFFVYKIIFPEGEAKNML